MQRNEHRSRPHGLADLLLPYALVDDGILLQQDGSLLTGWTYRGPEMISAAPAERRRAQKARRFRWTSANGPPRHVERDSEANAFLGRLGLRIQ